MNRSLAVVISITLVLIALLLTMIFWQLNRQTMMMGGRFDNENMMRFMMRDYSKPSYESLGEQIYLTGVGSGGRPIGNSMMEEGMMRGGMMRGGMMRGGMMPMMNMGCANCHGISGKGGLLFPDGRTKSKNIGRHHLKKEYSDKSLRRAITKGIDHNGKRLSQFMPRWRMTDKEMDALTSYLMTRK